MVKIGLRDFENKGLQENFDALIRSLIAKKPEAVKGIYFMRGYIKTTMGPPIKIDMSEY